MGTNETLLTPKSTMLYKYPENLFYTTKPKFHGNRRPLVFTYNLPLHAITRTTKQLQPLLDKDSYLHAVFPSPPRLAYQQPGADPESFGGGDVILN